MKKNISKVIIISLVFAFCIYTSYAASPKWGDDVQKFTSIYTGIQSGNSGTTVNGLTSLNSANIKIFPSNKRGEIRDIAIRPNVHNAQEFLDALIANGTIINATKSDYFNLYKTLVDGTINSKPKASKHCEIIYKAYTDSNFTYKILEIVTKYASSTKTAGYIFTWNPTNYQTAITADFIDTRGTYYSMDSDTNNTKNKDKYMNNTSLFNIIIFANLLPESAYEFEALAINDYDAGTYGKLEGLNTIIQKDPTYLEDVSMICFTNNGDSPGANAYNSIAYNKLVEYYDEGKPVYLGAAASHEGKPDTVGKFISYTLSGKSGSNAIGGLWGAFFMVGKNGVYANLAGDNQLMAVSNIDSSGPGYFFHLVRYSNFAQAKRLEILGTDIANKEVSKLYVSDNKPFEITFNFADAISSGEAFIDTCGGKFKYDLIAPIPAGTSIASTSEITTKSGIAYRVQKLILGSMGNAPCNTIRIKVTPTSSYNYDFSNTGQGQDDGKSDTIQMVELKFNNQVKEGTKPFTVVVDSTRPSVNIQLSPSGSAINYSKMVTTLHDRIGLKTNSAMEASGLIYTALVKVPSLSANSFKNKFISVSGNAIVDKKIKNIYTSVTDNDYITALENDLNSSTMIYKYSYSNSAEKPKMTSFRSYDPSLTVNENIGKQVQTAINGGNAIFLITVDWAGNITLKELKATFDLFNYL